MYSDSLLLNGGEELELKGALLDLVEDALIVRDLDDCIRFWNKGAERLYGWRAIEAIGQNINDLLCESLLPGFEDVLRENGEWRGELRQTTKQGKTVFVRSRLKLRRDQAGRPQSVLIANTDITRLKMAENQLLRSQRMETIGRLASGIAHDLNNELPPMLLATRVLEEKQEDPESRRWLEMFRTSAEHSGRLIAQLLSIAIGADEEHGPVQAEDLIRETVEILQSAFPKSIEIKMALPAGLWPIAGNATHLRQVVMNLCVNARDAMPNGGVLTIEAENQSLDSIERRVLIRITDTGIGMPAHVRSRIFEPFFTTKDRERGTGLGLFTVSRILASHRGLIEVSSEVGRGTLFKIYLPAEDSVIGSETLRADLSSGRGVHA